MEFYTYHTQTQGGSQNITLSPFKWPPGEFPFHPGASLLLRSLSPRPRCSPATKEIHKQHSVHTCVKAEDSAELPRLKREDSQTAESLHMARSIWTTSCFASVGWRELDSMYLLHTLGKVLLRVFIPVNRVLTREYVFYTSISWSFFHFVYIIHR